ncbi:hypothetical protein [Candidatus Poriferisodalis sp.]
MAMRKLSILQSPWFRSVVTHDPGPDIIELHVPVLAGPRSL